MDRHAAGTQTVENFVGVIFNGGQCLFDQQGWNSIFTECPLERFQIGDLGVELVFLFKFYNFLFALLIKNIYRVAGIAKVVICPVHLFLRVVILCFQAGGIWQVGAFSCQLFLVLLQFNQ